MRSRPSRHGAMAQVALRDHESSRRSEDARITPSRRRSRGVVLRRGARLSASRTWLPPRRRARRASIRASLLRRRPLAEVSLAVLSRAAASSTNVIRHHPRRKLHAASDGEDRDDPSNEHVSRRRAPPDSDPPRRRGRGRGSIRRRRRDRHGVHRHAEALRDSCAFLISRHASPPEHGRDHRQRRIGRAISRSPKAFVTRPASRR